MTYRVCVTAVEESTGLLPPRQLIVTVYGLYAREAGGWLSVASVVRLLADLGVDEPAVRSSISRLKRRGLLEARRVGGAAGYALSPAALEILADGDARIFGRRRATAEDGWVVVVFSVPEAQRERRHRLRSQLSRLGFGTAAPGAWVAPGHLAADAVEVLRRLRLDGYVELFRGEHLAFGDLRRNVDRWWDLDGLRARYSEFLERWGPTRDRWASEARSPAEAFADYVRLLTEWRRLPYADPGLPLDLLPAGWTGEQAAGLFADLRRRLEGPAHEHARGVVGG
jgi:phenylacetic acid degradation operon negative regulatory protein